ncbi:macro domain-containing protein [Schwartzia sp. (in: firmicutes)]
MSLKIVRNDITAMQVDAIVNSANPAPIVGGGVDYAIHAKAGSELLTAREKIGPIETGDAFITPGFRLPAKYVIHTGGPVWHEGSKKERELLSRCYKNCLKLALEHHCSSIAFPLISAGVFGCPAETSITAATQVIRDFLSEHEIDVYLVVFDRNSFQISDALFDDVQNYLDENYVDERLNEEGYRRRRELNRHFDSKDTVDEEPMLLEALSEGEVCFDSIKSRSLSDLLDEVDDTFSEALLRLIDAQGKTDPEVYKRANMDRRHFSKIRNNPDYQPSKMTALALAVALELNLDETKDFIGRAGYALSHSSKADIIVEYFIEQGEYDIFTINETLFAFGQPCLG